MTQEVIREMRRMEEKAARRRREEKERSIQRKLINLIKKYNIKIKQLEGEVKVLWQKEQKLTSEGNKFWTKITRWRRIKKQEKLNDLKKITPSIKFQ